MQKSMESWMLVWRKRRAFALLLQEKDWKQAERQMVMVEYMLFIYEGNQDF